MKLKYIIFIIVFVFLLALFVNNKKDIPVTNSDNPDVTLEDSEVSADTFVINKFKLIVKDVSNKNVEIIPNFNKKVTSQYIADNYNCAVLVNGGFYEEDGDPLGLYYLDGIYFSKIKTSNLYNGFLLLNQNNEWRIINDDKNVQESSKFNMQSGPILIYEGMPYEIVTSGSKARRIIFVEGYFNKYYIVVISDHDNFNSGPKLREIFGLLDTLKDKYNISIKNAINLDGGNSSLYIDDKYFLKESVFAGSFICFK